MNRENLYAWIDEQRATVQRSYQEVDKVVRDQQALLDLEALDDLQRILDTNPRGLLSRRVTALGRRVLELKTTVEVLAAHYALSDEDAAQVRAVLRLRDEDNIFEAEPPSDIEFVLLRREDGERVLLDAAWDLERAPHKGDFIVVGSRRFLVFGRDWREEVLQVLVSEMASDPDDRREPHV